MEEQCGTVMCYEVYYTYVCMITNDLSILKKGGVGLWCLTPLSTLFTCSVISWRLVLLVEETGVPRENHLPAAHF